MGWMDQLKKAGMSMVYGYLDQDPDRNLPKLIDWADQLGHEKCLRARAETVSQGD